MTGLAWYCAGLITPFLVLAGCVAWEEWCQHRDGRFIPTEPLEPPDPAAPALPRGRHRRTVDAP